MLLNKWKDGSAGHLKAMVAALVNATVYGGCFFIVLLLVLHLAK